MKTELFQKHILGTAITVLCLMGVCSPFNSPAQAQPTPPPPDSSTELSALPPNILPTSPLAQVIRLAQAGVDESIIMTYVTNSGSTFNLNPDKIIYLKDIGLPNEVITAMMQRDQQLQQQMTASAYQPPAQPVPETTEPPETAPAPQPVEQPVEQPTEVTVNYFYDNLAPYGTWVDVDGYGRCWRPSVVVYNPGWQPYGDHGHWVYTDCGWYWSSDYSWGWAPFHYGRWFQVPRWGWCWMPDTVWGPSWVTWRYSNEYCGWAPLPPRAVYREGVGFFYNGLAVSVGFDFGLSWNCFAFVPIGRFCDPHPRRYFVARTQVTQIYDHTTVINNFNGHGRNLVNRGIDPEHIIAVTHAPIRPVAIRDTAAPSGHGPRADQLSRDGRTLIVGRPGSMNNPASGGNQNNHPSPSGSAVQNQSPQPNGNQSAPPARQIQQSQVPVVTTHGPQEGNAVHVPAQHPSSSANYNSSPTPNYDNRTVSPRGRGQLQPSEAPVTTPIPSQGQHNVPFAAPVERPQHNEFSVPNQTQHPSPPANYSMPGQDNRTISPRGREQLQPSEAPRGNARNSEAPVATPNPGQGQHSESHPNSSAPASVQSPRNSNDQSGPGNGPKH